MIEGVLYLPYALLTAWAIVMICRGFKDFPPESSASGPTNNEEKQTS